MPPIIDSYSSSNWVDGIYAVGGDTTAIGQSFTGDGQYVQRVVFLLQRVGNPNYNLTARIYAHTGTFGSTGIPTGSILAESTAVNGLTLTGETRLVSFEFDGTFQAQDGVNYFVVFHGGEADGSNFFYVGCDNTSPTHAGNLAYYTSGAWTYSTNDLIFYVFGPGPKLVTNVSLLNTGVTFVSSFAFDAFNAVSGNLIFVYIRPSPQSTPYTSLTVTDTAGNTYTRIGDILYSVDGGTHAMFYAKNITGNASNVVTVSSVPDTRYDVGSVLQFSGLDTADPLDSYGALADHGYLTFNDPNLSGAFSTSNANDLIIAAVFGYTVSEYSPDFVEATSSETTQQTAYAVVDATKSNVNLGATHEGAGWASAGAAAFKIASGYVSKRRSLFRGRSFPFFDDEEVNRFEFWPIPQGIKNLTAAAAGTVTATASLTKQVGLTATAAGTSTATAALTVVVLKALTAAATGTATTTASLTKSVHLSASASGAASVSASLTKLAHLQGAATAAATVAGALTLQKNPTATVSGSVTATASLTVSSANSLSATASGYATVSAAFTVNFKFTATISNVATVAAPLTVVKPLGATAPGTSTSTAAILLVKPLTATAAAPAITSGGLTVAKHLAATVSGQGTSVAPITLRKPLTATSAGTGVPTVTITVAKPLTAAGSGVATTSCSLSLIKLLAATISTSGTTTATVTIVKQLAAAGAGTAASTRAMLQVGNVSTAPFPNYAAMAVMGTDYATFAVGTIDYKSFAVGRTDSDSIIGVEIDYAEL